MRIRTGKIRVTAVGDPATATHVLIETLNGGLVDASKEVPVDAVLPSKNINTEVPPGQIKRQVILNAYLNGTAGPNGPTFVHIHSPQFRAGLNNVAQGFGIQSTKGRVTIGDIADVANDGTYRVPYTVGGDSSELFVTNDEIAEERSEDLMTVVEPMIAAMLLSRNGSVKVDPPNVTVANAQRWYAEMSDLVAAHEYFYFN